MLYLMDFFRQSKTDTVNGHVMAASNVNVSPVSTWVESALYRISWKGPQAFSLSKFWCYLFVALQLLLFVLPLVGHVMIGGRSKWKKNKKNIWIVNKQQQSTGHSEKCKEECKVIFACSIAIYAQHIEKCYVLNMHTKRHVWIYV